MKCVQSVLLFLSFGATLALDQPASYLKRDSDFDPERGLFFFGQGTCTRNLLACEQASQNAGGNSTLPGLGNWRELIPPINEWLDNDPDPIWMDLIDLVTNMGSVSFDTLPQDISTMLLNLVDDLTTQGVQMLQQVTLSLAESVLVPAVGNTLDNIMTIVESAYTTTLAPIMDQFMPIILSITTLIQNVATALPQGSSAVMAVVSSELVRLTADITTLVLQMVLARDEATVAELNTCAPALMECRMTATTADIMPTIIGSAITIQSMESRRRV